MFASYPALSRPDGIHEAEVAFIAGYCAHLALDLIWHREVLQPVFLLADSWASNRQRYLVHNTLLTYLDREAVASLRGDAAVALASAEPIGWLPFARDRELRAWRDFIAGQLAPGGSVRTVGVFAGRMRMSEEEFAANLSDPDWMADYLFGRVPIAAVQRALDDAVTSGARLVTAYLEGRKSS
jgi:hypothetical protein